MDRHFDEELEGLKKQLVRMSALAETMIADSIKALCERNAAVIPAILERELEVDRMQRAVDETCLTLIALHQPAAGDLRFIIGAVKTNADVERLADQAINIVHKAERLMKEPPIKPFDLIPQMATIATGMVKDSLHAYVNRQVDRARSVIQRDVQLNELKTSVSTELTAMMFRDPDVIARAMDIILVARNLERIGDHAKNIAENIIFVVEGRDIRHTEAGG